MAASLVRADLAKQTLAQEGVGDVDPPAEHQEFVKGVCEWLKRWVDATPLEERKKVKPFGFVFLQGREAEEVLPAGEFAPSFRSSALQEVSGTLHACNLAMRNVHRKPLGFADSAAALAWLQQNVDDKCAAVIFVPGEDLALIKSPDGSYDDCETLAFKARSEAVAFDFSKIDEMLDDFHERWTSSHLAHCHIWAHASKRVLKPSPEQQIQGSLLGFLETWVRLDNRTLIGEEFHTRRGRTDVILIRFSEKVAIEICFLELKVLTGSRDQARDWALSGVKQLKRYRKSVHPRTGPDYLCCFDARKEDKDIQEVVDACKTGGVEHKRFYMSTKNS